MNERRLAIVCATINGHTDRQRQNTAPNSNPSGRMLIDASGP